MKESVLDPSASDTDPKRFRDYVLARLKGENVPPYLDTRLGEQPEDLLARLYFDSSAQKDIISNTLTDILWHAERDRPVDLALFSRAIALVARIRDSKLRPHLVALLLSDAPFLSEPDLYKRDMRLHLMVALQRVPEPTDPIDWARFLTDPRYTLVAFAGLISRSLDLALEFLPLLISTSFAHRAEAPLSPALKHLVERFHDQDVVGRIFAAANASAMNVDQRQYLFDTLVTIPTASATAKAKRADLLPEESKAKEKKQSPIVGTGLIVQWKSFSAAPRRRVA